MKIVSIDSVLFKGKKGMPWEEVENHLKAKGLRTVTVEEYGDKVVINTSFATEFCESKYTKKLKGALAKAKANSAQKIDELVKSASNRRWNENKNPKHNNAAKRGWYRYDVYFEIPVQDGSEVRKNRYKGSLVAKINERGIFLYDFINIKKEASTPTES